VHVNVLGIVLKQVRAGYTEPQTYNWWVR